LETYGSYSSLGTAGYLARYNGVGTDNTAADIVYNVLPQLRRYVGSSTQMRNQGTYTDFSDRNAIAQARLNNLEKDLGMTGVQFNTTVSMFVNSLPESTLTVSSKCSLNFTQSLCRLRVDADSQQHAHY
jgi:hypothetical protein